MKRTTYQQFDLVRIITTRNVQWRCDTPGTVTDPAGIWSIVVTMPSKGCLLIQKDSALAEIPASDVERVANFDIETVFEKIEDINHKYLNKGEDEDNGR